MKPKKFVTRSLFETSNGKKLVFVGTSKYLSIYLETFCKYTYSSTVLCKIIVCCRNNKSSNLGRTCLLATPRKIKIFNFMI